ncbi:hypothetical protein CC80DRAFT_230872 [Byssothecium circinans]|uniref:Uncharacterized protein n=1 Tax=Byssothecium circinans TaxID=147558 RepID=A0A6A5U7L8_9PLEO|nr:hypothetical protein CC80DRAFT_230872 [Byssothecium circinans]
MPLNYLSYVLVFIVLSTAAIPTSRVSHDDTPRCAFIYLPGERLTQNAILSARYPTCAPRYR